MRITLESDYALRILTFLATKCDVIDAGTISECTSVTTRFTLKILHKLVQADFVASYKGTRGGYKLKMSPEKITLKSVIELIDGPIFIARCLGSEDCALNQDKATCIYHHIFDSISIDVAKKLNGITIADILNKKYSL